MISLRDAQSIASAYVKNKEVNIGINLSLFDEPIAIRSFGWVFAYNSSDYILSGNIIYALSGNAPIIVDKYSGEVFETGTARDLNSYLDEYAANRNIENIK